MCDGGDIEVRPAMTEPVTATDLFCTGQLVSLCTRPVVRLDSARCAEPQVELASADRDDFFVGLTLTVDSGVVIAARAAATWSGDSQPVDTGWVQLYDGSLEDPDQLSGEIAIWMVDGARVNGRFSALTNPP
ncbi:MAG TPA: hypothetical protein VFU21_20385 [Kofleriaceae bacterium]|nr:hypothetical protein [Kofleriaceae bacterium]